MRGYSLFISTTLLILVVFIMAIILGVWVGYTNSKILSDSYNNYLAKTKDIVASVFGVFRK
jgi:uncharacterized protein HemY